LKIVALEPSGNLYGSEYCLLDVIEGTRPTGFDWHVMTVAGGGFDKVLASHSISFSTPFIANSHTVPLYKKLAGYLAIRSEIARRRPSVLYVNQAGVLRAAGAMVTGLGVPIVAQVQTLEDATFIAANRDVQRKVSAFIFNSEYTASFSKVDLSKRCILYQAVVTRSIGAERLRSPGDASWRVGILGRIAKSKGHYLFLDAARTLVAAGRKKIEFVVIGDGLTPVDGDEFREAVSAAGMTSHFDFRGYQSDLKTELDKIDLLVIPSPAETLGRVLFDACVANRPAIVADSGGLGELSRRMEVGVRFESDNSQQLAASIENCLDDYDMTVARFAKEAAGLVRRLAPEPYFAAIRNIIDNAAMKRPRAIEWLGEAL
jgi:glycosyltransferase involved in cell wall biosynthesis